MLNDSKTEILHLTSRFIPAPQLSSLRVGGAEVAPSTSARDLGVVIDEHVTMSQHVSSVCRSASFALYNIGKLRTYLDQASTEMLVHAFVSSRLDSCNSLLYGLPQNELERLQRVQNAAARPVSGVKGRVHMTPVLRKLHWLPISKRVMFKILLLTFKAINGLASQYIVDMLTVYSPSRNLRSTAKGLLLKPPSLKAIKTATYGDRSFSAAAPKLWNKLPPNIRAIKSLECFKSLLKTYLFNLPENWLFKRRRTDNSNSCFNHKLCASLDVFLQYLLFLADRAAQSFMSPACGFSLAHVLLCCVCSFVAFLLPFYPHPDVISDWAIWSVLSCLLAF